MIAAQRRAEPRRQPLPSFRANRRIVRYAGHRWRLVAEHGRFVLIERGRTIHTLVSQWVPLACVS